MSLLINKNEKIFVAGSTGMVGSAIKRKLEQKGYGKDYLGGELLTPSRNELDLANFNQLKEWFSINRPTVVIVAAAKVGGIYANSNKPFEFILENLKIQNNLIELAYKFCVKRLLFLGSSCIYPKKSKQPIREEYLLSGYLETTNEYYALAKISGIKLCEALRKQHNFDAICLMPCNLYGIGDTYDPINSHVIPALIRKLHEGKANNLEFVECWGSGNPLREFLYVDDLANACIFSLEYWNPNFNNNIEKENYELCWMNVGSDFEISIKELVNKISRIIGYKGKIIWNKEMPDGTYRKKLDTRKINSLGWEAKTSLDEGLEHTIREYEKNFDKIISD